LDRIQECPHLGLDTDEPALVRVVPGHEDGMEVTV
jgi:hypothetical protein